MAALALLAAALAARPCLAAPDPADPWEATNRKFFNIQQGLDHKLFGPVSHGYGGVVPSFVHRAITHVTQNLTEPLVMVNDLLQGHPGRAASTVGRFVINSIFGIGGLADVAARGGIPHHDNGFGLTLGRWGVGSGPYLFLPLMGPSTVRDAIGDGVDIAINPLNYISYRHKHAIGIGLVVVQGLETRTDAARDLETVEQTSTDPYATLKSYYLQKRAAEVADKAVDIQTLPDFDDPAASPPTTKASEPVSPASGRDGDPSAQSDAPRPELD